MKTGYLFAVIRKISVVDFLFFSIKFYVTVELLYFDHFAYNCYHCFLDAKVFCLVVQIITARMS